MTVCWYEEVFTPVNFNKKTRMSLKVRMASEVPTKHDVGEPHIIIQREVAHRCLVEEGHFSVEVHALDGLQRQSIVTQKTVHPQKLHQGEVTDEPRMDSFCWIFGCCTPEFLLKGAPRK